MNRLRTAFLCLAACFLFSSCIRTSTVVSVKKDGSGDIVTRYYFSPQVLSLLEQASGGGGLGLNVPDLGGLQGLVTPERESLEKDAAIYGEGVTYVKHDPGRDDEGWIGYTVQYKFDDIRTVKLNQNSLPGAVREYVEATGQSLEEEGGSLTFTMEGNELTIHSTMIAGGMNDLIDQGQINQAREMGMKPSQTLPMAASATQGMKIALFVRIEGEVVETTAEHTTGNLIIMSDTDVSAVMRDPDFAAFMDNSADNPDTVSEESLRELFRNIEGMTIELADEVKVTID
ncbi:MAG: hypothetical protein ACPGFB_14900 [Verrucomicrobiales bacterium]